MVSRANHPNSNVDHTSVPVRNPLIRIAGGSNFRFNAMSMNEYRNIIVPAVDAEMTSKVSG
jgi:hypothetical protein